jgi:hypothetical protein
MANHTTWERLFSAVRSLVSKRDIRDRVDGAYFNLIVLKVEEFPEELQQDVIELREKVIGKGVIREVVNELSNDDLESISYKFLSLYDNICRFHSS